MRFQEGCNAYSTGVTQFGTAQVFILPQRQQNDDHNRKAALEQNKMADIWGCFPLGDPQLQQTYPSSNYQYQKSRIRRQGGLS